MEAGTAVTTRTGLEAVTLARPFTDAFGTECVRVRSVKDGTPYGSARVVKLDGLTVKAVATDVETAPATDADAYTASQEAIPFRAWAELTDAERVAVKAQITNPSESTHSFRHVYGLWQMAYVAITHPAPAVKPVATERTPDHSDAERLNVNASALLGGLKAGEPVSLGTVEHIIELATRIIDRHEQAQAGAWVTGHTFPASAVSVAWVPDNHSA